MDTMTSMKAHHITAMDSPKAPTLQLETDVEKALTTLDQAHTLISNMAPSWNIPKMISPLNAPVLQNEHALDKTLTTLSQAKDYMRRMVSSVSLSKDINMLQHPVLASETDVVKAMTTLNQIKDVFTESFVYKLREHFH